MAEISIKGLKKLQKKLAGNADLGQVRNVVKQHGAQLQRNAQRQAPVDTGNLRRSINLEITGGGTEAKITPTAEYDPYVEYGTRYMNARPFLSPAAMTQFPKFKKDLEMILKK